MTNFEYMDGMIKIADDKILEAVVENLVRTLNEEGFEETDIFDFLVDKLADASRKTFNKL